MKNFTVKKWILNSLIFFIAFILVTSLWNFFDDEDSVSNVFTTRELIKAVIVSLFVGFFISAWVVHKPKDNTP